MKITRIEHTSIEQTIEGREFADEYEQRLKDQGVFRGRKEDTQFVTISAEYHFIVGSEEKEK